MKNLWNYLNPRYKAAGLRWHSYHAGANTLLILVLIAAAAGYGLGYHEGAKYTAAYYRGRYAFPGLRQPSANARVTVRTGPPKTLPAQASIVINRYPSPGDQGEIGSCAAWASAYDMTYEYRILHPRSNARFSARCLYDHFSDTYSNGQDGGSWPNQDLELVPTQGVPRFRTVPYGPNNLGLPAYAVDNPVPSQCAVYGIKVPVNVHTLVSGGFNLGQGAVDMARATLAGNGTADGKPHPVLVALSVYPPYDNATQQPLIVVHTAGQQSRGGHENVFIAYDDTMLFPDGSVGGFEIQNQWSKYWGLGGRAWYSYEAVRQDVFGLQYLTIGAA